ncbi:hypothetical protein AMJ39_07085 [candidate division TA06 bacterium DG_24]|uniref:Uncharacterized protein n=2 Tax=Bacteria division TA06 TaxID=1156500 RepID=A0A0S8G7J1_UNCT6|nr:MAG: hypothetical protein AMJ39_07085 [candidate division TA06 bacterium DG_24]KPK68870.1 MAG: hypothetical protein AMJ82_07095 [candidate division TA06 bacterium SM23_40]
MLQLPLGYAGGARKPRGAVKAPRPSERGLVTRHLLQRARPMAAKLPEGDTMYLSDPKSTENPA